MPEWNLGYVQSLHTEFQEIKDTLPDRLDAITDGRIVPKTEDLSLGAGKKMRGAILFFDIRGFTNRTGSPDDASLKQTLYMINSVIPMIMKLVHDHGGYVEKNTGDGIMAILGAEAGVTDSEASKAALNVALSSFYLLEHIINPHLIEKGIAPVQARIGIDLGTLLIARVGVPKGSSSQDRSFLTAICPSANLASKLQQNFAETNQIWVGDLIKKNAPADWQHLFIEKTPPTSWTWSYHGLPSEIYRIWHFNAIKVHPTL